MNKSNLSKPKRGQNNFKLRNEYYGTEPIDECFKKAFEPYFDPNSEYFIYSRSKRNYFD